MKNWTQKAAAVATAILNGIGLALPPPARGDGRGEAHIHWMLLELQKAEMSPTKACRWLGYVQCYLVTNGVLNLDDAKVLNQRAGDGTLPAPARDLVLTQELFILKEQLESAHQLLDLTQPLDPRLFDDMMDTLRRAMACVPSRVLVILTTPEGTTAHQSLSVAELPGGEWKTALRPLNVVSPPPPLTGEQHDQVISFLKNGVWEGEDRAVFRAILAEVNRTKIQAHVSWYGENHVRIERD